MDEIYYVPRSMPYPLSELGGRGPLAILLPANGFPPDTYRPALAPVLAHHRVVSLPPRAFWDDSGPAPAGPGTWLTLAQDVLEGMRRHALPPAIVIGHSFGCVAALLAAVREPARFRALALLDPTIPPPAVLAELEAARQRGETSTRPLVRSTLTRRDRFEGPEEAFEYWKAKPLFADWPEEVLRLYARAMLRPRPEGGFSLSWPPAWESHYYESIYTESWAELDRLDPALPLLVVRGETSNVFVPEAAELFHARVPWAERRSVPGRGHLFPQSAPAETGRILAEWLGTLR